MLTGIKGPDGPLLSSQRELFSKAPSISQRIESAVQRSSAQSALDALTSKDISDTSVNELEKHLDDLSKHRGYLSGDTGKQLIKQNHQTATELNKFDPASSKLYAGIISGLNYQLGSRFVNALSSSAQTSSRLQELASIDQEKVTEDLIKDLTGGKPGVDPAPVVASSATAAAAYASNDTTS